MTNRQLKKNAIRFLPVLLNGLRSILSPVFGILFSYTIVTFFSKELLMDWRMGAAYFESLLIDYDVHSNYGNWMYTSGVGNDPRDRKFNIRSQAERYDANGKFQRLWSQQNLFE